MLVCIWYFVTRLYRILIGFLTFKLLLGFRVYGDFSIYTYFFFVHVCFVFLILFRLISFMPSHLVFMLYVFALLYVFFSVVSIPSLFVRLFFTLFFLKNNIELSVFYMNINTILYVF